MNCYGFTLIAPPAAIDIGTIITIVIILISLIGWLVNLVNEKQKQPPARRADPQAGGGQDRFQQEIDQFLQEVGGKAQQRRHHNVVEPEPIDVEVVSDREIWEREREERRGRKISTLEDRHVESSDLSGGLRQHVDSHMRNQIAEKVEQDIDVVGDLGDTATLVVPTLTAQDAPRINPAEIVQMLRDRDGVRKAIIVNEILRRPNYGR